MILAKTLWSKGDIPCPQEEADTFWGHEGSVLADHDAKRLGVIGSEYDANLPAPVDKIVMRAGRIGSSKAVKPDEDKELAPDEDKGAKGKKRA